MINVLDIRRILVAATRGKLLIAAETEEEADVIRREIEEFVDFHMSRHISVWRHSDRIIVGGFYDIYVMPLRVWNDTKRYKPFSGTVLITDKRLSGVKNIAEGVTVKLLPVERSGKNAEMS